MSLRSYSPCQTSSYSVHKYQTLITWSDGIFSLVTSSLNAESCIETPRDIQRTHSILAELCCGGMKRKVPHGPTLIQDYSAAPDTRVQEEELGPGSGACGYGFFDELLCLGSYAHIKYLLVGLTLNPDWPSHVNIFAGVILWNIETQVRNWCKLMPGHASLRNAYRSRKTDGEDNIRVPQSFSFFPREGWFFIESGLYRSYCKWSIKIWCLY